MGAGARKTGAGFPASEKGVREAALAEGVETPRPEKEALQNELSVSAEKQDRNCVGAPGCERTHARLWLHTRTWGSGFGKGLDEGAVTYPGKTRAGDLQKRAGHTMFIGLLCGGATRVLACASLELQGESELSQVMESVGRCGLQSRQIVTFRQKWLNDGGFAGSV